MSADSDHNLRDRRFQPVGELIERFIEEAGLKPDLAEAHIRTNWADIAGAPVAARTTELFIRRQTLILRIDRPALRQELAYHKARLIERVNQSVGYELITSVRLA